MKTYSEKFKSPVGELILVANERALVGVLYNAPSPQPSPAGGRGSIIAQAKRQLTEYFAGKRQKFDLPLEFTGTDFQKRVWKALLQIPYGETRSYADIAREVGSYQAVRAVGLANSKNPISIIAPCHRVIGSNGKLTGYAGGLDNKKFLLKLEHAPLA